MSTLSPVPQYPPPPQKSRSMVGPLILIALGVLLMLGTMGMISLRGFGIWFARYWPAVLIVWGAVKLAEYSWARQKGEQPSRLGAGSIVLVVFFVLIGISATSLSRVDWHGLHSQFNIDDDTNDFFGLMGNSYEFTDTLAQPVAGGTEFKVLARRGSIKVTPSADAQAHLVVHKTLRTDTQEGADSLNTSTRPSFVQQGSLWILDATGSNFERGRFDLDLQLPRNAALSLSTRRGDITVSNRDGALDISTDHGDVSLDQIKGNASLHMRGGTVTVKDVSGDVQVDGTVDDGSVSGVGGSLDFNAGYNGEIQLAKIGKQLHFKSVRTTLQAPKLDGEINMSRGNIRGSSVTGPFRLETRSNDIRLEDASGDVHVDNRNGIVEVRTKAPLGSIDVTDSHGDITVDVPASAGFQLDAESTNGNITAEFTGINVDSQQRNATARGTVGKGGPTMRLRSDRGTIQIRKQ
ncbi:MAG: DUF4097 family beta strand repeat-containing protein [Acidobacteriia bacterium]|nr:DUF4097 family beta strand repeat-containing protein [Terriglobia bacterium]